MRKTTKTRQSKPKFKLKKPKELDGISGSNMYWVNDACEKKKSYSRCYNSYNNVFSKG